MSTSPAAQHLQSGLVGISPPTEGDLGISCTRVGGVGLLSLSCRGKTSKSKQPHSLLKLLKENLKNPSINFDQIKHAEPTLKRA